MLFARVKYSYPAPSSALTSSCWLKRLRVSELCQRLRHNLRRLCAVMLIWIQSTSTLPFNKRSILVVGNLNVCMPPSPARRRRTDSIARETLLVGPSAAAIVSDHVDLVSTIAIDPPPRTSAENDQPVVTSSTFHPNSTNAPPSRHHPVRRRRTRLINNSRKPRRAECRHVRRSR